LTLQLGGQRTGEFALATTLLRQIWLGLVFAYVKNRKESFLRQFNVTDLLHTFLTFFLLLQ
jgi:hypothetical protein